MQYPVWAPQVLIDLHIQRHAPHEKCSNQDELDDVTSDIFSFSIAELSRNSTSFYKIGNRTAVKWTKPGLPDDQHQILLGDILRKPEMKGVWETLRQCNINSHNGVENQEDYLSFWRECELGILGYTNGSNLTKSEHTKQHQQIHDLAMKLAQNLNESDYFKNAANWLPSDIFHNGGIESLIDLLKSNIDSDDVRIKKENYLIFLLSHFMLRPTDILDKIAKKAYQLSEDKPIVLQPFSHASRSHFFIISLSKYLNTKYGQPLHTIVAKTASMIFRDPTIEPNKVGKLVQGKY